MHQQGKDEAELPESQALGYLETKQMTLSVNNLCRSVIYTGNFGCDDAGICVMNIKVHGKIQMQQMM